jgi:hypothetical protein
MATFDVTVYETAALANEVGGQAKTRAKTYIEGAFSHSEHSVNVTASSTNPDAPTEQCQTSFSASDPCYPTTTVSYDYLSDWWRDYVQCVLSDDVMDADLLLTAHDGGLGRTVDNRYAVSEGGPDIANLPSDYTQYGCDSGEEFDDMQTALHELAHALLNESDEHDLGYAYDHSGTRARTPMARAGEYNACDNYVYKHDGCHEMRFSECCESKMTHTY